MIKFKTPIRWYDMNTLVDRTGKPIHQDYYVNAYNSMARSNAALKGVLTKLRMNGRWVKVEDGLPPNWEIDILMSWKSSGIRGYRAGRYCRKYECKAPIVIGEYHDGDYYYREGWYDGVPNMLDDCNGFLLTGVQIDYWMPISEIDGETGETE